MTILALDVGTKSLGIAVSDDTLSFSLPVKTLTFDSIDDCFPELLEIIKTKKVSEIVIGLPKNMDGSLGFAAKRSIEFKTKLESNSSIPIFFVDERLSSVEAEKVLLDENMKRKKRKKVIDSVAASIILDTYLKMKKDKRS